MMLSFAEKIRKLRKEREWSQDVLADKIGIHGRHVSKYEGGKSLPNAETLVKIADALHVSIDYLLMNKEIHNPDAKIKDLELLKAFVDIDQMDDEDKFVIKKLVEAFVKKRKVEKLMKEDKIPA